MSDGANDVDLDAIAKAAQEFITLVDRCKKAEDEVKRRMSMYRRPTDEEMASLGEKIIRLGLKLEKKEQRIGELKAALRVVLRFHGGSPWTEDDRKWWAEVVGDEATTRGMCDYVRSLLGEGE